MPIKVTKTYVRPNKTVGFYKPTAEYQNYVRANYDQTGKRLSVTENLSPDELTLIVTVSWKDQATFDEWLANSVFTAHQSARAAYLASTGIAESTRIETV